MNNAERLPVQQAYPLAIEQIGLVSALGSGWELNGAAMRAGYSGVLKRQAACHFSPEIRGYTRMVHLLVEALKDIDMTGEIIPVLLCTSEESRPGLFASIHAELLIEAVLANSELRGKLSGSTLEIISRGRAALGYAFERANFLIHQGGVNKVLVLAVDSLLNAQTINAFRNPPYREGVARKPRLLSETNADGFVPGEGAGALLVARPSIKTPLLLCLGSAITQEHAVIDTGEPCKAKGLTEADKTASLRANLPIAQCHYRIASVSGEEYFFSEASLAQTRALERKTHTQPLWHPASYIGDVGAVVGVAIIVMAAYAAKKRDAPGDNCICHLSNDDADRVAFFLQTSGKTNG